MNSISEDLRNQARSRVRAAVKDYNSGYGLRGMYGSLVGTLGWRVEYCGQGHHTSMVVDAVHELYEQDSNSGVDKIYKEALEKMLAETRTLDVFQRLQNAIFHEIEIEMKGKNAFTIDVDDAIKKLGALVTNAYDDLKEEYKKVNADFDEDFLHTQWYALDRFGLFVEAEQFKGKGQLGFLREYIGGDIEFDELTEDDLREMLKTYRASLPREKDFKHLAEVKVGHGTDEYFLGYKPLLRDLLLGREGGNLTYFEGAGHNYKLVVNTMQKVHQEDKERGVDRAFESCMIELIQEADNAYDIKLLANTAMHQMFLEYFKDATFKIDFEKLTGYFIENIRKNHDKYISESPDFDTWIKKKPVAREKTPKEIEWLNEIKANEQREKDLVFLRRYVGWDKEFDEMSEEDTFELHKKHMPEIESYKAKIPELTIRVEEAVRRYRSGDKGCLIDLLRGRGSGKVEFISGTGHAYRVIIDILHEIYQKDNNSGVLECLDDCLYDMAEGMRTMNDLEEMTDIMIYEREKEKGDSASFEINTHDITAAMRRNNSDNKERHISEGSDYMGIWQRLVLRAIRVCGDRLL